MGLRAAVNFTLALAAASGLLASTLSTTVAQTEFNHDRTGFHLEGAHVRAPCLACHGQGILRGTPKTCNQCHIQGNRTGTTIVKGPGHVPVSIAAACDTCHTSTTAFQVWRMDHTATTLQCGACHNGQRFEGVAPVSKSDAPSPGHVPTVADCLNCHNAVSATAPSPNLWSPSRKPQAHNAALLSGFSPAVCFPCHGLTAPTYYGVLYQCGTAKGVSVGSHSKCTATGCAGCHAGQTAAFR
jgi:hypothetical protein